MVWSVCRSLPVVPIFALGPGGSSPKKSIGRSRVQIPHGKIGDARNAVKQILSKGLDHSFKPSSKPLSCVTKHRVRNCVDTGEQNNASEPTTPGVCRGLHITAVPFLQEHLETMLVGNRWVRLAKGAMAWCAPSCPWQKEGKSIPCLVGSPDKIRKKDATEQQAGLCVCANSKSSQYPKTKLSTRNHARNCKGGRTYFAVVMLL